MPHRRPESVGGARPVRGGGDPQGTPTNGTTGTTGTGGSTGDGPAIREAGLGRVHVRVWVGVRLGAAASDRQAADRSQAAEAGGALRR